MVAMTSPDYRMRDDTLDRMVRAVEKVRERVRRAAGALAAAGIPYAVAGGNAVAAWVAEVDEAAVRNTADIDILNRRQNLKAVIAALEQAGFEHRHAERWRLQTCHHELSSRPRSLLRRLDRLDSRQRRCLCHHQRNGLCPVSGRSIHEGL